jgi:hypothetical protein
MKHYVCGAKVLFKVCAQVSTSSNCTHLPGIRHPSFPLPDPLGPCEKNAVHVRTLCGTGFLQRHLGKTAKHVLIVKHNRHMSSKPQAAYQ